MSPYLILFFALLVCGLWEIRQGNDRALFYVKSTGQTYCKILYELIPVLMILFLGIFRETTMGYDSQAYLDTYWAITDDLSWGEILTGFQNDNGFFFVLKFISLFTKDWWAARAILFTFTFLLYYIIIVKYSPYPSTSLIIMLGLAMLGLMFSILRQALAGAITLYAFKHIRKGSWVKCLLLIMLAATVHKSALLCVFMLVLYFPRFKKFSGKELAVLSAVSYLFFIVAVPLVLNLYVKQYIDLAAHDGGYGMLLFMVTITVLILYLFNITGEKRNGVLGFTFNLSCGALFIQIGALVWSLLNRATVYFSFYWCLLLPNLLYKLPYRKRQIFFLVIAAAFGFMFFHQIAEAELYVLHKF